MQVLQVLSESAFRVFTQRFWSKIVVGDPDACWSWTGALSSDHYEQYGKLALPRHPKFPRKFVRAHRISYFLTHGELDPDAVIMHICDNPICCNPKHLKAGTQKDNMMDMAAKKRGDNGGQTGQKNANSLLTEADVVNILSRIRLGETNVAIAKDYGVSHAAISSIRRRKTWTHVSVL